MNQYISPEVIDRISQQVDIVQLISEYIPLTRAGKNYKALCPFHEEKTPSFIVSPAKQVFHCFGCGVGGNVFTFLMKWENISFPEAVKLLGEKVGIPVSLREETPGYWEQLYRINEKVTEFFQNQLRKNKFAREYLYKRGFKDEVIDLFRLGWAPYPRLFIDFCKKQGFPVDKLKELGLITVRGKEYYPYFRERIVFPIFSLSGKIIGFGGRVLDDSLPKYLNSPQSPVFDKGKNLYGLNIAREYIRKEGEAILVEGYTDVIALHQEGIRNAVASLGTSLTIPQVRMIKRYASRVFLAYDEDTAGEAATLRGIDLLLENDLQIKVISFSGEDPAELVRKKGKGEFLKAKEAALSYIDYRINKVLGKEISLSLEKKLEILNSLFFTLEKITSRHILDDAFRKISESLNLNEESLRSEFKRFLRKKGGFSFSPVIKFEIPEQEEIEKRLLQVMLHGKDVVDVVKDSFSVDDFTHPLCQRLAREIFTGGLTSPSHLITRVNDEELSSLISSLTIEDSSLEGVDLRQMAMEIVQSLKRRSYQRKIQQLYKMIRESEYRGEEDRVKEYCQQLIQLRKSILR